MEFAKQPRKILNEIYHILIPEGHIVIIDFNPSSLWGFMHLYKRNSIPPWQGKFISIPRMCRWLKHLGFSIVEHKTFLFRPPLFNEDTMQRMSFMEKIGSRLCPWYGAIYMIVAKKTVAALTPIKQQKHIFKRRVVTTKTYAEPTTRTIK